MNRKGAVIAIYMTVVIAIILSAYALFNFLNHGDVFGERTQDNEKVITQMVVIQDYIEGSSLAIIKNSARNGFTKESIIESGKINNLHIAGQGNFFDKIEQGEFEIVKSGENYILNVKEILVFSQYGKSSAKRVFDLNIEVDSKGEFIRFINN